MARSRGLGDVYKRQGLMKVYLFLTLIKEIKFFNMIK
jgi:hypothetical protein